MTDGTNTDFDDAELPSALPSLSVQSLDALRFGAIGFDADGVVRMYNLPESRWSGLHPDEVIGRPLFTEIAQCMNNYLVAERFKQASANGVPLDVTIDYILTWRIEPTPVRLRLVMSPDSVLRYVLIHRSS